MQMQLERLHLTVEILPPSIVGISSQDN